MPESCELERCVATLADQIAAFFTKKVLDLWEIVTPPNDKTAVSLVGRLCSLSSACHRHPAKFPSEVQRVVDREIFLCCELAEDGQFCFEDWKSVNAVSNHPYGNASSHQLRGPPRIGLRGLVWRLGCCFF
jgi:hypothetical protein